MPVELARYLLVVLLLILLTITLGPTGAADYPLVIQDQFGRAVRLNSPPQRIVSGSPGNTELLFALGLGERVIGVTDWCDYPPAVKGKPRIGNIAPLNIEKVLSLRPDLVLACNLNGKEPVENLTELGVPTFALNPVSFSAIIEAIRLVGQITGQEQQAAELATAFISTIEQVKRKGQATEERMKVLVAIGDNLQDLWTAGSGTFLDEVVTLCGGENIAAGLGFSWARLGMEYILKMNPDLILTELEPQVFLEDPFYKELTAGRKRQIYQIDVDVFSRPGPRLIEALNELVLLFEQAAR